MKSTELEHLILSNEGYKNHPFAHDPDQRTYVYTLKTGKKSLTYFGSTHTNDPRDIMFRDLHGEFVQAKPDIVYVEGYTYVNQNKDKVIREEKIKSLEETKLDGEGHFTLKLAVDAGIAFESPEPPADEEIAYILNKGFSKRDIFSFYVFRMVDQYLRTQENPAIEKCKEYIMPTITRFKKDTGWNEKDIHNFTHEIINGFKLDDPKFYRKLVDPIPWDNRVLQPTNEISSLSSNFRDIYIFRRIKEGLKKHNSLFVVYGSAHAVKHEPALRALFASLL